MLSPSLSASLHPCSPGRAGGLDAGLVTHSPGPAASACPDELGLIHEPSSLPLHPQIKDKGNPALLASNLGWFVLSFGMCWVALCWHRTATAWCSAQHRERPAPDRAMGACGAEHPQESQAGGFAWLFLGALGASQQTSKKVCFILGAAALWLSPALCQALSLVFKKTVGSRGGLERGGGLAAGPLGARQSLLTPLPPRR